MSKTANLPKVTIITVTYNAEATLERTLQSVAALDYAPLEYLLIDGGSSDGTLALLQAYEAVIDHWVSEPDEGLYDAMNKGMALASGDYLWFLNAGDEAAAPDVLQRVFAQDVGADIYYGDTLIVDGAGQVVGPRRLQPPDRLSWRDFRRGMLVSHQALIVARRLAGPYDLSYRFSADYDWALRLLRKSKHTVNTHLVLARFLDGGLTKKNILPGLRERFTIMNKNYGYFTTLFNHIGITCKFLVFWIKNRRF
jgi:glycosyltransferase involved in cell wall biosynthesis